MSAPAKCTGTSLVRESISRESLLQRFPLNCVTHGLSGLYPVVPSWITHRIRSYRPNVRWKMKSLQPVQFPPEYWVFPDAPANNCWRPTYWQNPVLAFDVQRELPLPSAYELLTCKHPICVPMRRQTKSQQDCAECTGKQPLVQIAPQLRERIEQTFAALQVLQEKLDMRRDD